MRLIVLMGLLSLILIGPLLSPHDPMQTNPALGLQPPGNHHLFGTDRLGRDVLSRFLQGGQRTLLIALLATLVAVVPGTVIGTAAGWYGGWIERGIDLIINAVLAFPGLLLALVIVTVIDTGAMSVAVATGAALIAQYTRITRAAVIGAMTTGYLEAARAAGAKTYYLLWTHILPTILPTLLMYLGIIFSYSLLNSAALTFLGLGGGLGEPDWGAMLYEGRMTFRAAPWESLAPGIGITLVVFTVNSLADRFAQPR